MATFFITSSLMVIIIIAARFLLKNKASFLILYPLWGIVLLRLLIPVTFIESNLSIMNLVYSLYNNEETPSAAREGTEENTTKQAGYSNNNPVNKNPGSSIQKNSNNITGKKIKTKKNTDNSNIITEYKEPENEIS